MDQQLGRVARDADSLEESGRTGALLVHLDLPARPTIGVPDGVGAALGDPREQRAGRDSPLDAAVGIEAISGDSAQSVLTNTKRPSGRSMFLDASAGLLVSKHPSKEG